MAGRGNKTQDVLNQTTSKHGILVGNPIEPPNEIPERKRPPKIEVRYRGRIFLCSGEKGGTGKTLAARSLIEILLKLGFKVLPVDADVANLDIEAQFKLNGHIDLQQEGGYINLLNLLEQAEDEQDTVVSLPAGALAGANVRGAGFLDGLPHLSADLGREVVVIWPIDDKELSVSMLREFIERCPGIRVDVVGNKFFFDRFDIYDASHTKTMIEEVGGKFITIPRLHPQVMQRLVNEKLSFDDALRSLPIGARYELQRWIRLVETSFSDAGYLSRGSTP